MAARYGMIMILLIMIITILILITILIISNTALSAGANIKPEGE